MDEVQKILKNATIDGTTLKLPPGELERDLYLKVDAVLKRLWGKWNGRKKVHDFTYDPTDSINAYVESGVLPPQNELSYFPTPKTVIDDILTVLKHDGRHFNTVLEPSAGQGAIASAIKELYPDAKYDLVEHSELHTKVLTKKGWTPHHQDFLIYETPTRYDLIVMNPPFNTPGLKNCWIDHLYHAYDLLDKRGTIFCIIPAGWETKTDKKHTGFKEWASDKISEAYVNEAGTFKESGTNIRTLTLRLLSKDDCAGFDADFYVGRFHLMYDGSYGKDLYRQTDENRKLTAEQYVDKIIAQTMTERTFFECLAMKYREQYIAYCKAEDKEYDS